MHFLRNIVVNKTLFLTTVIVLIIFSSIISYPNISLDLYFNYKYINYAKSFANLIKLNPIEVENDLTTFPIWGYGIIHWLFNSSKLSILIFQQGLNFITIYLTDKILGRKHQKPLFIWRILVLSGFPYFLFHTQIWPKSISSSLLIIAVLLLIKYFDNKKKIYLIFSGLFLGLLSNFRSDYIYFILSLPIFLMIWEVIKNKKISFFSISILILPFITLLFLIPWGLYTKSKTDHYLLTSTNSGHVLFIGLGQLNNNIWNITPRDDDPKMQEVLMDNFKKTTFISVGYEENQYLKKIFFSYVIESPIEWLKKCVNNIKLIFLDPFYVGNVGDFQKNGISNVSEIRRLESSVYQFDFKNSYQIIQNTHWKFSVKEMLQLSFTIITKLIGLIIFLTTILSGLYILLYKSKWYFKTQTNFLLSILIIYQITLSVFVFHMPVYNTSIYLIYLIFISLILNEIFFYSTVNKNKGVSENNIP